MGETFTKEELAELRERGIASVGIQIGCSQVIISLRDGHITFINEDRIIRHYCEPAETHSLIRLLEVAEAFQRQYAPKELVEQPIAGEVGPASN